MRRDVAKRTHLVAHLLWGNDMGKILQFPLSQIPDNGLDVALDLEMDDLEEVWFRASSLKLIGKLEKTGSDEVSFQGRLSGRFLLECSLGLAEFIHPFSEPLAIYFSRMPQDSGSEGEVELNEEDLEVAYIKNETVDMTTPVRDQIGLAIPFSPGALINVWEKRLKLAGNSMRESPSAWARNRIRGGGRSVVGSQGAPHKF